MRLAGIFVVGLLAGCSIVFNTNDLPRVADAPVDSPPLPADARIYDVNPNGLTLTMVEPSSLAEGTGTAMGRPAVVVVSGTDIDDNATVTIVAGTDPVPLGLSIGAHAVGQQHDLLAFEVTVPIDDAIHEGDHVRLAVRVQNPGGAMEQLPITIDGLDNFTPPAGNVDVKDVRPRYAQASFTAATHFIGAKPLHLRVTGGITISASVDANGGTVTPGPGGCPGGGASADGDCGNGRGRGGGGSSSGVSGGGGGFGDSGKDGGGGAGHGIGGMPTGDRMLVALDYAGTQEGNRGNGGGGGGGALLGLGTPGSGGGGGGTLDLAAGGTISVQGGSLHANGGDGTGGSGVGPGAGGAGSGGAIVIRSGAGVISTGAWLTVDAGAIGVNGNNKGGVGGAGRIRVDTPIGTVTDMASSVTPAQGPSWAVGASAAPTIVSTASPTLPLVGEPGATYGVRVGTTLTMVTLVGAPTAAVPVTLAPGLNHVCAVADANAASASSEPALDCIDVAYVP